METLTISRVGEPKTINYTNKKTGRPDSFQKVGFQTNEYGTRWYDVAFRGNVPVQVGQSYEFETSEREYNGKTYYEAKLPKEQKSGGMSGEDFQILIREVRATNANTLRAISLLEKIWGEVDPNKGLTSAGTPEPNFDVPDDMFPTR